MVFLFIYMRLDLLTRSNGCTIDMHAVARDEIIGGRAILVDELIVMQVIEKKLLMVVGFLLIHIEILAIEIEQAVGEFVAGQCPNYQ